MLKKLDLEYFKNKKYQVPLNIPETTKIKYLNVIALDYAKYLDVVYHCGKFIVFKQFYKLVECFDGESRTEKSNETIGLKIIHELERLGFIKSDYVNRNKYFYLRKPAIALCVGDYNTSQKVNLARDLKNRKFKTAILHIEYFLKYKEVLHNSSMMWQLKHITEEFLIRILQTGNKYNYDIQMIEDILKLDDYTEIKRFIESVPEYVSKLDIIRELWLRVGELYRKMILQNQTVLPEPAYLKLHVSQEGKVLLHYLPNIAIFDVSFDEKYYSDRMERLFHAFFNIEGNVLMNVQKAYLGSKRTGMGYNHQHHIGYKLTLVGIDKELLLEKKKLIDSNIGASINSPLMDYADIVYLPINQYILHASRRSNSYGKAHDERIEREILNKLNRLNINKKQRRNREDIDKEMLDLYFGN